jgi:hypothetical protein
MRRLIVVFVHKYARILQRAQTEVLDTRDNELISSLQAQKTRSIISLIELDVRIASALCSAGPLSLHGLHMSAELYIAPVSEVYQRYIGDRRRGIELACSALRGEEAIPQKAGRGRRY